MALLLWSCLLHRGEAVDRQQMNYLANTQPKTTVILLHFFFMSITGIGWDGKILLVPACKFSTFYSECSFLKNIGRI